MQTFLLLNSFNLAASQAVSANINAGMSTVNDCSYLLYVGLPSMVGSSVGVGYSLTESNALSANFTLCHSYYLQKRLCAEHLNFLQFQLLQFQPLQFQFLQLLQFQFLVFWSLPSFQPIRSG